jgi:ATP phosphoribosyltransferase regulatory subunit
MKRDFESLKQPEGMRDTLPDKLVALETAAQSALRVLSDWSYKKVSTPGLEYYESLLAGAGSLASGKDEGLYKFFDRDGEILALRPEFTTPIARMAATWYKGEEPPFRFCYAGPVYRNREDRYREFHQVGAELVGAESCLADAEILTLAVEVLRALGLRDFQISLGHNGVLNSLLTEYAELRELQDEIRSGIARKDNVQLENMLSQNKCPRAAAELLQALPSLRGGAEVLNRLSVWEDLPIRQAVETLRTIYSYLEEYGVQKYVTLDMGILGGFSYYTGALFEGYLPGVGTPIIDGGRYDSLYAEFGYPQPATGFSLNLALVAEQMEPPDLPGADVFVYGQSPLKVIRRCRELRRAGKKVEMALSFLPEDVAKEMALSRHIGTVERVG